MAAVSTGKPAATWQQSARRPVADGREYDYRGAIELRLPRKVAEPGDRKRDGKAAWDCRRHVYLDRARDQ